LKNWGGGEAGSGAPEGSSGGSAGLTGSAGSSFGASEERARPDTQVQVVIQGSIYDSDETGSRILDLINKNFDKTGQTIAKGAIA
jgi:hypothetical protein